MDEFITQKEILKAEEKLLNKILKLKFYSKNDIDILCFILEHYSCNREMLKYMAEEYSEFSIISFKIIKHHETDKEILEILKSKITDIDLLSKIDLALKHIKN